ncbi:chemotaxis protein [Hapalosiphon sp. MRB220]|nr:chemotaxis protein [Hapalosiphon sp. MRB220]
MTYKLVVIGTSLGGLEALQVILSGLPKTFPIPIAVVQHRHKSSDDTLRLLLQSYSNLIIKEAEDKEDILSGHVYLAPADYHLLIDSKDTTAAQPYFSLSTDAPVTYARPSIDVLFETAADAYHQKLIGVLLTGANQDGVQGLAKIKARGGMTIVEEPESAYCSVMPAGAIALGVADKVLSLLEIPTFLVKICSM